MLEIDQKTTMIGFITGFVFPIIFYTYIMPRTVFTFIDIVLAVVLGAGLFLMVIMFQHQRITNGYPVNVMIFEQRAGTMHPFRDRAKRINNPGADKFEYVLRSKKIRTKPIDWSYVYVGNRGQNYLHLYSPQPSEFYPMMISDKAWKTVTTQNPDGTETTKNVLTQINPTHENAKFWYGVQIRQNVERYYKKFGAEKYIPIAMVAVTGVVLALVLYLFMGEANKLMSQMGGISIGIAETQKELVNLAKALALPTGG